MNLANVIRDHAHRQGSKTAIYFRDQQISYAKAWSIIEHIAAVLHQQGVESGDRVGLCMREHPWHLLAHYAVARLSAVIVPMDHRWSDSEKVSAAVAFTTAIVLTEKESTADIGGVFIEDVITASIDSDLPPIQSKNTDLLISLSSGTTGKPKGALVTHQNLYERFVSQWHAIGYGSDDVFAIVTPFYFGAGRSFGMSMLAAGGGVAIIPPPMKPPEIVQALSSNTITAAFLPPTLLRRLFDLPNGTQRPLLAHLNFLIVSGEPLFADEAQRCIHDICENLVSYYASSEGGGISVLLSQDIAEFAATVGKPTYKTEVQIVDEDDKELAASEVGRLRYRGPGVATRYLASDGAEHDAGVGGWFYPGDLAEKLLSGHIALRGRDKDVIIRGGINIYPSEIEATLLQHSNVTEAAVIGRRDAERGEIVSAFIVASELCGETELVAWCKERLAPYKIPQDFYFLDAMPKSSSGKTNKKELLKNVT